MVQHGVVNLSVLSLHGILDIPLDLLLKLFFHSLAALLPDLHITGVYNYHL